MQAQWNKCWICGAAMQPPHLSSSQLPMPSRRFLEPLSFQEETNSSLDIRATNTRSDTPFSCAQITPITLREKLGVW